MTKKKDLITHEEVNRFLKRVSYNKTSKSNLENVLKLLQELQIILDEGLIEDSIDGTRIRVKYDMDISRRRRGEKETGEGEEKQRENAVRYQYIKEIPIDYSKVPISFRIL
jgi:tRNA G37 N-methylase Trm5